MIRIVTKRGFYAALLAIAGLVNASGYLLRLWHDETIFDEAVHLYTSFAVVAALGWLTASRRVFGRSAPPWWIFIVVGIILGIAWEAIEWVTGIIGGRRDTLIDLIMDTVGAVAAAALVKCAWPRRTAAGARPSRSA